MPRRPAGHEALRTAGPEVSVHRKRILIARRNAALIAEKLWLGSPDVPIKLLSVPGSTVSPEMVHARRQFSRKRPRSVG